MMKFRTNTLIKHCATAILLLLTGYSTALAYDAARYAPHSKLAEGRWVKIAVDHSGIFQITAADARNWGFPDLSKVHVYGFGGAPLSEVLSADAPDDLPAVPVMRHDDRILFYAQGPITWQTGSSLVPHVQVQHPYSTLAYYFVSDQGEDVEAPTAGTVADSDTPIHSFTERTFHEEELTNPGETGRVFLGEDFRYTKSQSFKFALPGLQGGTPVQVLTNFAARSSSGINYLTFQCNGNSLTTNNRRDSIGSTTDSHCLYLVKSFTKTISTENGATPEITFTVNFSSNNATLARLDYITVNYQRALDMTDNSQLCVGLAQAATSQTYRVAGGGQHIRVWDVTQPWAIKQVATSLSGTDLFFSPIANGRRELVVWSENGTDFDHPTLASDKVKTQDLHGQPTPDLIIISPAQYLAQAERVAAMHRTVDKMRVLVVDQEAVYNEFSSGTPDFIAYRHLAKMMWDRGADSTAHRLGYLLLMGCGNYNNRTIGDSKKALNYPKLLTWKTPASNYENNSYTSDDYCSALADGSGAVLADASHDIAVGRFPVRSLDEARTAVDKLIKYTTRPDFGSWKASVLNVADDEDMAAHMEQAENLIQIAKANGGSDYQFNHVFIDAFDNVSNGSNREYPEARNKLYNTLREGVVWWNYTGHASPNAMTANNLLRRGDVAQNLFYHHLPVLYAATCEFTRFDGTDPSCGEQVFLNANGGAIAVISPPRLVYSGSNGFLNAAVGRYIFSRDENNLPRRVGDILRLGKNRGLGNSNSLRYFLLGDPAMRLAMPSHRAVIESINGTSVDSDTLLVLQARQTVTFTGSIIAPDGQVATGFNGAITSTLFDRADSTLTHGNGNGKPFLFYDRENKLAVSVDSVTNGKFNIKITLPSEMLVPNYDTDLSARINLYAYSTRDSVEAIGSSEDFCILGFDHTVKPDTVGPVIETMGLNTAAFNDGDEVNENPQLLATVSDANGINLATSGIGHAISLTLDEKTSFNNITTYYTPVMATQGSRGNINYPLTGLAEGPHTLRLKVWDVYNNSSQRTITFNVVNGLKPEIADVYALGNPASVETKFYVKHNRPDAMVTVTIEVFDLMGRRVWNTVQTGRSDSYTTVPITWTLQDNGGRRVQRGIYIYRAIISTDGIHEATKSKKLAVTGE